MSQEIILIVDDEPFNVDYLEQELQESGYATLSAFSGSEALEIIAKENPALVLLDIMMPVMDGFEVLRRLKGQEATRDIPVIIISADSNLNSVVHGIQLGAEDYLPKPFEPTLLHARISSSLEKKRLRDIERLYLKGLERELEIGRQIQQGFLPELIPTINGWEVGTYFKAAREVAGDYYDAFTLPDGKLVCLVGDVCGKGVGAALFMSLFRSLIRALATSGDTFSNRDALTLTEHEFLTRLVSFTNQYVCDIHGESGLFTTLFICLLEPDGGKLTYLNAGNEPPFWLSNNQQVTELRTTGPVIGIISEAVFSTKEIIMQPGDILCAFTDGITDALDSQEVFYGRERLLKTLRVSPSEPGMMIESVLKGLGHFTGSTAQFDDISLLVVKKS